MPAMPRVRVPRLLAFACWVLVSALQGSSEIAAGQWVDWRTTGPIVCRAEFALKPYEGLLRELGQLQADLVRLLKIPLAREPIELYLFSDKASYDRFHKQHLPNIPYRRALYIKSQGVGRVYAYRGRELATDVRHECTHALLHAALPLVPLWLDEGLAEYFEVPGDKRAFENPHLKSLRWDLWLGKLASIRDLESNATMATMGKVEYRSAWAWVHFMAHGSGKARDELVRYLQDIHRGTPPGQFSQRLQRRLDDPEKSLAAHFKSWRR